MQRPSLRSHVVTSFLAMSPLVGTACSSAPPVSAAPIEEAPRISGFANLVATPVSATPADYDGDGKADVGLRASDGFWLIDYAKDGFGNGWDAAYAGYGGGGSIAVPADYDGDGKADLAIKRDDGVWSIDFAANGFGLWDASYSGYGNNASFIPAPADYDGDGKTDISTKDVWGVWHIDFASNGFGSWDTTIGSYSGGWNFGAGAPIPADFDGDGRADLVVAGTDGYWRFDFSNAPAAPPRPSPGSFGALNVQINPAGWVAGSMPAPADYDGDGKADIAFKDPNGVFWIDGSRDGFYGAVVSHAGYGGWWSSPAPADYDGDHYADLSVMDSGTWYVDTWANGGFGAWNTSAARMQVRTWSFPYVNQLPAKCGMMFGSGGPFASDSTPTGQFEQQLLQKGCGFVTASGSVVPGKRTLSNFVFDTQSLGFSITLCPDTPDVRNYLGAEVGTADQADPSGVAKLAQGGGPYVSRVAIGSCFSTPPAGRIWTMWDPHCQGGCPLEEVPPP